MLVLIIKSIFIITMKKFLSPILFSFLLIGCSTVIPVKQVSVAQDAITKQEKKMWLPCIPTPHHKTWKNKGNDHVAVYIHALEQFASIEIHKDDIEYIREKWS